MTRRSILAIILVFALSTGSFLSACSKKEDVKPSAEEKKDSSVPQLIAVINEDMGVEYSSGIINYSEEFIKTLDEEHFDLVSANEAEEGLKQGSYSGVLMFPSNLSFNILNLNYGNPQKIDVNYKISNIAEKDISDEAYDIIIEAYQNFNNRLSYAYINALMEEVELGQYNVAEIFKNDGSNIEAAKKLINGDYNALVELPNMPERKVDYSEQDANEYRNTGSKYVDDVDKLYQEAYKAAYDKAAKKYGEQPDMSSIDTYSERMVGQVDQIGAYRNAMVSFSENDLTTYCANVGSYIDAVENYKSAVDAYLDDPTDEGKKNAIETAAANMANELETTKIDEGLSFSTTLPLPTEHEINQTKEDLENKIGEMGNNYSEWAKCLEPGNMINVAMDDPDSDKTYREKLAEKRENFETLTDSTTDRFNTTQKNNITILNDAYKDNSEFMTNTVKSLNEKSTKDQESIEKAVKEFKKTAEGNSFDTRKRLESFESMLSGAKVDGRVSSEVVKFLIQPIQLIEKDITMQ